MPAGYVMGRFSERAEVEQGRYFQVGLLSLRNSQAGIVIVNLKNTWYLKGFYHYNIKMA